MPNTQQGGGGMNAHLYGRTPLDGSPAPGKERAGRGWEGCGSSVDISRTQIPQADPLDLLRPGLPQSCSHSLRGGQHPWELWGAKPQLPSTPTHAPPARPCPLFPALTRTKLPQPSPPGPSQVPGTGNHPWGTSRLPSRMTDKRCGGARASLESCRFSFFFI